MSHTSSVAPHQRTPYSQLLDGGVSMISDSWFVSTRVETNRPGAIRHGMCCGISWLPLPSLPVLDLRFRGVSDGGGEQTHGNATPVIEVRREDTGLIRELSKEISTSAWSSFPAPKRNPSPSQQLGICLT